MANPHPFFSKALPAAFGRVAIIARWKPVHLGHQAVLRALTACSRELLVGIGSANRYNLRNPFTLQETCDMLNLILADASNYRLLPVDDLDDGPRWRTLVGEMFDPLDAFVTDNPYVASLLKDDYRIIRPVNFVAPEARVMVDGSLVRREMARGDGWKSLVPGAIANYMIDHGLDRRFRDEFGLQTLALETIIE